MIIIKKAAQLGSFLQSFRNQENSIGFAPTMGALHQGHLSLIAAAKQYNSIAVTSIFVNPAQFNDKKDFEKYPVTLETDIEMLAGAGCDLLFLPSQQEIYPNGYGQPQPYALGQMESLLEGAYRPGHFQGVCRVMHRLMDLVQPDDLFMGQKDYQQCMVVARLLALIQSSAALHTCPTLREIDGLAMSSRNMRLSATQRQQAGAIYQALQYIKKHLQPGSTEILITNAKNILAQNNFRTDYVAVADAATLQPVTHWNGQQQLVALAAAFQGEVRLIDNILLH
jgi:pantoate--beta-alanine ligase